MAFAFDVLPLPLPKAEGLPAAQLSRGVEQRIGKRRFVDREIWSLTESMNWLAGCQAGCNGGALNSTHRNFLTRAQGQRGGAVQGGGRLL